MSSASNPFQTLRTFTAGPDGARYAFHSLPALAQSGFPGLARLPVSIRVVLESVLRNCDGRRVPEQAVRDLAGWQPRAPRTAEIPFVVGSDGIILYAEQTASPKELPNFAAIKQALA